MTRPLALVTGASSGIGRELARLLAQDGHDLALVARRRELLEELAGELTSSGATVVVLPQDLSEEGAATALAGELAARGLRPEVLVNNAGVGTSGFFAETPLDRELAMIRINVVAPTELTKLLLPAMLERRRGRILNVASTAAFQPGPLMAVYYATKAYLLSFSEALANETAGTGVTVTALCPGPTRTRFQQKAGVAESRLFHSPLVSDVEPVARAGYEGMKRGRRVVVPGLANKVLVQAERLTPRRWVTAITRAIQENRTGR